MRKVYIVQVEVRPLPGAEMLKGDPTAKGAFVDVIVAAGSTRDAKAKATEALREDSYEFIRFEQIGEINEVEWDDEDLETQYKAMAWDALNEDQISYGPFYSWSTNSLIDALLGQPIDLIVSGPGDVIEKCGAGPFRGTIVEVKDEHHLCIKLQPDFKYPVSNNALLSAFAEEEDGFGSLDEDTAVRCRLSPGNHGENDMAFMSGTLRIPNEMASAELQAFRDRRLVGGKH